MGVGRRGEGRVEVEEKEKKKIKELKGGAGNKEGRDKVGDVIRGG